MRVRRSLTALQDDWAKGDKAELETLWRAWRGIKELPPDDPNSFFVIGGYHGEPFRGAGWGTSAYWGGYCNHGNVLFPTWHRAYLLRLEEALCSIPGCADVTLPFWDETSDESAKNGIPWALTAETVELDGETIPNPLRSFVFNRTIVDHLSPFPDADYGKPTGYETVRYPLSGLVGPADIARTTAHNKKYSNYDENVRLLDQNVVDWLTNEIVVGKKHVPTHVRKKYRDCLDAPNYTLFSNTTSAAEWNGNAAVPVVPLESPHNDIHLAVGGFDIRGQFDASHIPDANGDMGENDTAAFDPIFYFHHCHIDRMFWLWQQRHASTRSLAIWPEYPGTNTVDNQGPTPGVAPNSWLDLDSPLAPFRHQHDDRFLVSRDLVDIEGQLGYTYGPGSFDELAAPPAAEEAPPEPHAVVSVRGVNRAAVSGSFLVSVFANVGGVRTHLGTESVLSRWHVEGCMNCQTHLEARAHVPVPAGLAEAFDPGSVEVEVRTRGREARLAAAEAGSAPVPRVSVRLRDPAAAGGSA